MPRPGGCRFHRLGRRTTGNSYHRPNDRPHRLGRPRRHSADRRLPNRRSLNLAKTVNLFCPPTFGDLTTVDNLPTVRQALLDPPTAKADQGSPVADWLDISFPDPVPVIRAKARPERRSSPAMGALDSDVVTRPTTRSRTSHFFRVTLKDLFSAPCSIQPLFRKLFHLVKQGAADQINRTPESLFDKVAAAVAFSTSSGLTCFWPRPSRSATSRLATFGTWTFLGWRAAGEGIVGQRSRRLPSSPADSASWPSVRFAGLPIARTSFASSISTPENARPTPPPTSASKPPSTRRLTYGFLRLGRRERAGGYPMFHPPHPRRKPPLTKARPASPTPPCFDSAPGAPSWKTCACAARSSGLRLDGKAV